MTYRLALLACFVLGCDAATDTSTDSADPCAGVELDPCPPECPTDYTSTCGQACTVADEACGNSIGDGRVCVDDVWQCSVHAPLGGPGVCNAVCDDSAR